MSTALREVMGDSEEKGIQKGIEKAELSTNEEGTNLYKERKEVVKKLQVSMERGVLSDMEETLWEAILIYQDYHFLLPRV